jgi:hypothetical protein
MEENLVKFGGKREKGAWEKRREKGEKLLVNIERERKEESVIFFG